ncbi:MAG TPA: endonuclease/exonuclease/phosphatase family protein [Chthoniobacteraceae bacterium]|nr:endonuclease/exonuclease/phosphatase family protein [Chthoniobacteraceae bacterium]
MMLPGSGLISSLAAGALRVWLIVGILLRVTRLRDGWDWLALVYYSTPWPAIAVGFVVLALHARRKAKGHAFRRYVLLTGAALFTWIATSWYGGDAPPPGTAKLRVVLWNVAHPESRLARQAAWLKAQDADIIALAEADPDDRSNLLEWSRSFPDHAIVQSRGNMLCIIRGEVLAKGSGELASGSQFGRIRARVRGRELTILQADIYARPRVSRRAPFARLHGLVEAEKGPLILLGDFNTPRESALFDPIRKRLTQSFEAAGHGLAETWPSFAPALSIDQIWTSAPLRPLHCEHGWTTRSDHRPVTVDLAWD